jgi:hypothetical protein
MADQLRHAGLVPGIRVLAEPKKEQVGTGRNKKEDVDGRDKPGYDEE